LEAFGSNQLNNPLIKSVILNVRDITDRKKAEQALRESEARLNELNITKDRFFMIIGHDLKTPFNSILGISNLIVEKIRDHDYEGLDEYASLIQESSQRAMDLLNNLLEWSQAQTGRIQFHPENINLETAVNNVMKLLENAAHQKSISILKKIPANLTIFADRPMIHTILSNLIANGIKFTNPGGKIIISTDQKDNELIVSITDNGVGIKKEDLDKLFRLESNYSKSGTNQEVGTGLGLLLCKEFVEMHQGKIMVESELGKGSRFNFSIPKDSD
jgi:signal transduction histidine kinase